MCPPLRGPPAVASLGGRPASSAFCDPLTSCRTRDTMPPMRTVDLWFRLKPHFGWKVASERRSTHESGAILQSTIFTSSCHAYTHVDAPVHFLPGQRDIAEMPVDQWMGPAAVVDLTHLAENGEVTAADLESRGGHVERGDIGLLRTDGPLKCAV